MVSLSMEYVNKTKSNEFTVKCGDYCSGKGKNIWDVSRCGDHLRKRMHYHVLRREHKENSDRETQRIESHKYQPRKLFVPGAKGHLQRFKWHRMAMYSYIAMYSYVKFLYCLILSQMGCMNSRQSFSRTAKQNCLRKHKTKNSLSMQILVIKKLYLYR